MKPIVLIAAMDAGRAIGRGNDIPWHIPGEQKVFKQLTMGNALVMGRMTYLSLPGPLPGRHCIVLSRSFDPQTSDVLLARSLNEALSLASELPGSEITVGGGQEIYELFLPIANRIHLTVLDATFGGDRFFPMLPENEFSIAASERVEGAMPYTRFIYERSSGLPISLFIDRYVQTAMAADDCCLTQNAFRERLKKGGKYRLTEIGHRLWSRERHRTKVALLQRYLGSV